MILQQKKIYIFIIEIDALSFLSIKIIKSMTVAGLEIVGLDSSVAFYMETDQEGIRLHWI